ncbi:hypothetical protein ADK67_37450 [Saccharothrix sp. NRRL B-16348]|uniref:hypothetical protein n=1 Tax=Saccharothrix sp. NRRL B-16348 TaxID=1415542 RepID=UPI0006AF9D93|nr:hypothetical protein [Saccharothrix sp. NRRL B-16348]KOX17978.1 hypothetical protein ADK67_37450 [Saccharothrix sp. NRRL B-16348]
MRKELRAYLRRSEGKLAMIAALTSVSALLLGLIGLVVLQGRQNLLDDAVERRGVLTSAALDIYRAFADADATSLDAVLVNQQRSPQLQQEFRENVFDALDALRTAAERDGGGSAAERVQRLTDLVPQYVQLVETGWSAAREGHPVATSYLSQASFLARDKILEDAAALHREQITELTEAQSDASSQSWTIWLLGLVVLGVLHWSNRFLFRHTKRRYNTGLIVAAVLTGAALVVTAVPLLISSGHADDSIRNREQVVAPLAEARNVGRSADGNEARLLIYPSVGDKEALKNDLARIAELITEAQETATDREHIDQAADATRKWTDADAALIATDAKLTYPDTVALVTPPEQGRSTAELVDEHLTAAISAYTTASAASTAKARAWISGLDVVFALLMAGAAIAALAGLRPRIAEYYR